METKRSASGTVIFFKKPGETPLEALTRLREESPELRDLPLSYAGRLDPLAEGELLVLVGETCKERQKYLNLDKTYKLTVLLGLETDTGDVLGKITKFNNSDEEEIEPIKMKVEKLMPKFIGPRIQTYPIYSSKPYKGKPLFHYAQAQETIPQQEIPKKKIEIYDIKLEKLYSISKTSLKNSVKKKVRSVSGNFRQKETLLGWENFFSKNKNESFITFDLRVHCSSGTYMRVLAQEIGRALKRPALALHIKKEKIHLPE